MRALARTNQTPSAGPEVIVHGSAVYEGHPHTVVRGVAAEDGGRQPELLLSLAERVLQERQLLE